MNNTPEKRVETPRTDAEEKNFFSSISGLPDKSRNYVPVNFARQLEQELQQEKILRLGNIEMLNASAKSYEKLQEQLQQAQEEVRELKHLNSGIDHVYKRLREFSPWTESNDMEWWDEMDCGFNVLKDYIATLKEDVKASTNLLQGGDELRLKLQQQLQQAREELARHNRDGNWCDKWGACRVCDGEIPHGHTDNCDVYKQEQQIRDLQSQLSQWQECASGLYRLVKGLFTTQQQVDEILARYDELLSTPQTTESK